MKNIICCVVLLSIVLGCEKRTNNASSENSHQAHAVIEPNEIPKGETTPITIIPNPTKEGKRRRYVAGGIAFNLRGTRQGTPLLTVVYWQEHRLPANRRSISMLDEHTRTSLIFIFEDSLEGTKEFSLADNNSDTEAWLLWHSSDEGKTRIRDTRLRFLANPLESDTAFKLEGSVALTMTDGFISQVTFTELNSIRIIKPNTKELMAQMARQEQYLERAELKLEQDPNSELSQFEVEHKKMRLQMTRQLLESDTLMPAFYKSGRVVVKWGREKPLFEIELL